jgi:hypothetical protein
MQCCLMLELVTRGQEKRVSLLIQLATLVGILIIITVSYHSLIHTRRAAVRESLEQLDDIRFATRSDVKVKPILYRCRGLVFRGACEVKFKFYGAATPGASDPSAFIEFPESVFTGYDVRTQSDGYVISIDSNNPVEIRRKANEIMLEMYNYEENDND